MHTLPRITSVYLNTKQNDKLTIISSEMKLNKDSLVNFWLSRGLKYRTPSSFSKTQLCLNSFFILNDIKAELNRSAYNHKIELSYIASTYLKDSIDETY